MPTLAGSARTLLYLSSIWPEPRASAAGVRVWNVVRALQRAGWRVHFASASDRNAASAAMEDAGVAVHAFPINDSTVDDELRRIDPDAVLFDRFVVEEQWGWRIESVLPKAARFLDLIDLHSLRHFRQQAAHSERGVVSGGPGPDAELSPECLRELSAILRSDHVFFISEREQQWAEQWLEFPLNPDRASVSRFWYDDGEVARARRDSLAHDDRRHVAMIGNARHAPNVDAMRWCAKDIWPRVRKRIPGAELHYWGAYLSQEVTQLADDRAGIRIRGFAPDAIQTLGQYRVHVAPLRFGAGIKGKIADAWVAGTPTVMTRVGAEGMVGGDSGAGAAADVIDDVEGIATRVAELLGAESRRDQALWQRRQAAGWQEVDRSYLASREEPRLAETFDSVVRLKRVRGGRSNAVSRILHLNSLRATEYLSRWIEAKNKRQGQGG